MMVQEGMVLALINANPAAALLAVMRALGE